MKKPKDKEAPATRPTDTQTINPYLAGRREWNERYGSYVAQRDTWRLTAICALGVSAICAGGLSYMAVQNHVVPYVIEVDKLGQAVPVTEAERAATPDARIIRAQLASFVANVRSVYTDVGAERTVINHAYAMLDQSSPAGAVINDYFSANTPFNRAQNEVVTVNVESVLPLGGNTWRVEWQEIATGRDGRLISNQQWQANITTAVHTPTNEATILVNPMGIYVTGINWSERL
jgi:type IV secretion system protein TrbF